MKVVVQHCRCVRGKSFRVRDMLVAEGFEVEMVVTRRPHFLKVIVNGNVVWSLGLWRSLPSQKDLAELVRKQITGE